MENTSLQAISDVLAKHESFAIAAGKNPNLDEMGAALSLYLALKAAGKQVTIATPLDPLVEISSLVGIDRVKKSLLGEGGDLVVSFPYQEGEIEKVSYTLEDGHLNIIVKAAGDSLSFSQNDVQYKKSGNFPQALFVVGTARLSDLGSLFDPQILKDVTLINIDNKKENQGFGEIVLVSDRFSSVSEQVAQVIESLGLPIDLDIAQNLLSGISYATENFQSAKTSVIAFEQAAKLMQKGAKRSENVQKQPAQPFVREQVGSQPQNQNRGQRQQFPSGQARPQRPPFRQQNQPQFQNQPAQNPFQQVVQPTPNQFQDAQAISPRSTSSGQAANVSDAIETQKADEAKDEKDAPPDWLTPKVYKGSTLV